MSLCGEDILKIDQVTKMGIYKSFTYLSYVKDKQKASK